MNAFDFSTYCQYRLEIISDKYTIYITRFNCEFTGSKNFCSQKIEMYIKNYCYLVIIFFICCENFFLDVKILNTLNRMSYKYKNIILCHRLLELNILTM